MKNILVPIKFLFKRSLSLILVWTILSFNSYSKNAFSSVQNYTIKVIDEKSEEPLIGATVWNVTLNQGTTTDIEGNAFLENVNHRDIIEIILHRVRNYPNTVF